MSKVSFKANTTAGERTVECEFDFGSTLQEAVDKFGEAAVFANFNRQAKVGIQAYGRSLAGQLTEAGEFAKTDEEVVQALSAWMPSDGTVQRVDKSAKLAKILETMSDEERAEFLEQYM